MSIWLQFGMPQKTRKEKMKIHQRKEEVSTAVARNDDKSKDAKRDYFIKDIRKSLLTIGIILGVEVGLYIAVQQGAIPFIPQV